MNIKFLTLVIFVFILFSTVSTGKIISLNTSNQNQIIDEHPPIRIIGNDEFLQENGVSGGSGTKDDPYIIENWLIISYDSVSQGIFINRTDAYFIIRNCVITGFQDPNEFRQGIEFSEVKNGRIDRTIANECQTGISIRYSSAIILSNCTCFDYSLNNGNGIGILQSFNITIISSRCYNVYTGIGISKSLDIKIINTDCCNNMYTGLDSFAIEPTSMRFFIENCTFQQNNAYGIHLIDRSQHSSYFIIRNCSFYSNNYGILIERLCNNIIENCNFYNNSYGLIFDDRAENNIVRNCRFVSQTVVGMLIQGAFILLHFAPNNEVSYCDFFDNEIGLLLSVTRGNKIHHCNIVNNSYIGICTSFSIAQINSNNIFNNGLGNLSAPDSAGVYCWHSYLNLQYNWWGSHEGPCISLLIGRQEDKWKIVQIRTIENADTILFRQGFACYRSWLFEPVFIDA